jgi:DMSO/TMAO reductase YedYZ molybdopterin-dependent catalytic subunit
MEEHGLIVFAMNGQPLPNIHGGPVRLVMPGWPGSLSHKWLTRIWIRDREHDGQGRASYRVAIQPMVPGGKADEKNFARLRQWRRPLQELIGGSGRKGLPDRAGGGFGETQ